MKEFIFELRKRSKIFFTLVFASALIGFFAPFFMTEQFEASAKIKQENVSSSAFDRISPFSGILGGFSGIGSNDLRIVREEIISRDFIEYFINNGFVPETYVLNFATKDEINEDFRSRISVKSAPLNNFLILEFRWNSPEGAALILNNYVIAFNDFYKNNDLKNIEEKLKLLLSSENEFFYSNQATQDARSALIEEELRKKILIESSDFYVLKFIEKAHGPKYRSTPNRKVILVLSVVVSILLFLLGILAYVFFKRINQKN